MLLYTIVLAIFLVFEIQNLVQFNFFFRIICLSIDYKKSIPARGINSVINQEIIKLGIVNLFYLIVLVVGLFTINLYFICTILILMVLQSIFFNIIKNKTVRKIYFATDIVLSATLLLLSITNLLFYNLNDIEFIKKIISLI